MILFSRKQEHFFEGIREILITKPDLDKLIGLKKTGNIEIEFEFQDNEYWKNIHYFEEFKKNEGFRNKLFKKYFNNKFNINHLKNKKLYFYDNSLEYDFSWKHEIINLMLLNDSILLIISPKFVRVIKKDCGIIDNDEFMIINENENNFYGKNGIIDEK